jgi:hypothetical protein
MLGPRAFFPPGGFSVLGHHRLDALPGSFVHTVPWAFVALVCGGHVREGHSEASCELMVAGCPSQPLPSESSPLACPVWGSIQTGDEICRVRAGRRQIWGQSWGAQWGGQQVVDQDGFLGCGYGAHQPPRSVSILGSSSWQDGRHSIRGRQLQTGAGGWACAAGGLGWDGVGLASPSLLSSLSPKVPAVPSAPEPVAGIDVHGWPVQQTCPWGLETLYGGPIPCSWVTGILSED